MVVSTVEQEKARAEAKHRPAKSPPKKNIPSAESAEQSSSPRLTLSSLSPPSLQQRRLHSRGPFTAVVPISAPQPDEDQLVAVFGDQRTQIVLARIAGQ